MIDLTSWKYIPGRSLALEHRGEMLAHYEFNPSAAVKPFVHPLCTLGGTLLTSYQPSDHVWHRGLWFSWKYINDINYWEEESDAEGRLMSEGTTIALTGETLRFDGDVAILRHRLNYIAPGGELTMSETRQVRLCPPAHDGAYRLDFSHAFTVGGTEIELSATPVAPETPWGGYAGLGVRTARSLQKFKVLTDKGYTNDDANGARSKWIDLSGVADGGQDLVAGITLFDHPDNLRHPSPTYVFYDATLFGYSNLSLVRDEPLKLAGGDHLHLAYRVLVHDGWANPTAYNTEWNDFAASKPFDFLSHPGKGS